MSVDNARLAALLYETADMLDVTGASPFRSLALRRAARQIRHLPVPAEVLRRKGELTSLPGVGPSIAAHVGHALDQGDFPEHRLLAARVPRGVLDLLRIDGIGPRTAAAAWMRLGIVDRAGLIAACQDGRILCLPRMGERRARRILDALGAPRAPELPFA